MEPVNWKRSPRQLVLDSRNCSEARSSAGHTAMKIRPAMPPAVGDTLDAML